MDIKFGVDPLSVASFFACKHADEAKTRHEKRLEALEDMAFQNDLAMTQYYVRGLMGMGPMQAEAPCGHIDDGFGGRF